MKDLRKEAILVCPRNDEESLMILKIAEKMGLKILESSQARGAKLDRENNLVAKFQEIHPSASTLVIVEIPGPSIEKELEGLGYDVVIVDHHVYDDLDRMKSQSSIEQFIELFKVDDLMLKAFGFDPKMVEAVGAIDRGFLWELENLGWSEAMKAKGRKFYRSLRLELGEEKRLEEEAAANIAWDAREEKDGVLVVRSESNDTSIRDAVSYLIADEYGKPTETIVVQGDRRVSVQESDRVGDLMQRFGGYTFGGNRCWGILKHDGSIPSVDEVLEVLRG